MSVGDDLDALRAELNAGIDNGADKVAHRKAIVALSKLHEANIVAESRAAGVDPYDGGAIPVSLALRARLREDHADGVHG